MIILDFENIIFSGINIVLKAVVWVPTSTVVVMSRVPTGYTATVQSK